MFRQTFTHALVVLAVAVLRPPEVISEQSEAFVILGVASAAAVEKVQAQPFALVVSAEHNCRCQHAVDWIALETVETCISLFKR